LNGTKDVFIQVVHMPETCSKIVDRIGPFEQVEWNVMDARGTLLGQVPAPFFTGECVFLAEEWSLSDGEIIYRAEHPQARRQITWAPPRLMPRRISRQTLRIASIRPERLRKISAKDIIRNAGDHLPRTFAGEWESNPFVWRIEVVKNQHTGSENNV
jgi:hypothetical protein